MAQEENIKSDKCKLCTLKLDSFFSNEYFEAALYPYPVEKGHIIFFPKDHVTIFEQISNEALESIALPIQLTLATLFQKFEAKGTSLFIKNGVGAGQDIPHFTINLIPRTEDDGLALEKWNRQEVNEERLKEIQFTLINELAEAEQAEKGEKIIESNDRLEKGRSKNEEVEKSIEEHEFRKPLRMP